MRPFCLDCGSEVCAYEDERVMVPNRLLDPATVADLRARWDAEVPSNAEVRSDPERLTAPNRLLDPATVADLRARWDAEVPSNAEVRSDPERLTAVISPGLLLRKHGEITDEGQG